MKRSRCLGQLWFLWRVLQLTAVLNQNENAFAPAMKVLRYGIPVNKATIFGLVAHMPCLSLYMHTYFCSMFWCKKSAWMVDRVECAELCPAFGFLRILLRETMQAECKSYLFHRNFSTARVSSPIISRLARACKCATILIIVRQTEIGRSHEGLFVVLCTGLHRL